MGRSRDTLLRTSNIDYGSTYPDRDMRILVKLEIRRLLPNNLMRAHAGMMEMDIHNWLKTSR